MIRDTARNLIAELESLGVSVWAVGDKIRFRPQSAVPDDLLQRMRQHKPELLEYLRTRGEPWDAAEASRLMGWAVAEANRLLGRTEICDWSEHDRLETAINQAVEARDMAALRDACRRLAEWAERMAERH